MKTLQVINSPVAKRAVKVGRKNKRRFRPLACADELEEPLFFNDWWYIPIAEDDSAIPEEASSRVNMLKAAEIEVVDLIVAHETTKLLPPPAGESTADKRKAKMERRRGQLAGVGKAASLIMTAMFLGALAGLELLGLIFGSVLMIDPALIAVVRDPETGEKVWIEVATWYD